MKAVSNRTELAEAINGAAQAGAIGTTVLLGALWRGEICHQQIQPGGPVSEIRRFVKGCGDRPSVLLIGDDDGMDRGPAGWPGVEKAITWGRWFLLHGAAAERHHYELAIAAAHLHRRVVVIECSSATMPAWQAIVAKAPNRVGWLGIKPRAGSHPILPPREELQ
jgi:hypothetical protein